MGWTPALIQKVLLKHMTTTLALIEFSKEGCAVLPDTFQVLVPFNINNHTEKQSARD